MDLQLAGKSAIVTGGSRGIGLAVATALAAEGTNVALVGRNLAALEHAAETVRATAASREITIFPVVADTTDDVAVRAMVDRVVTEFGGVDILVNGAAPAAKPGPPAGLAALTDDEMRDQFETKVLGYLRCARAVAPLMAARGWGRIVNISGLNARLATSIPGSVRNVAVAAMTKNLADELGPAGIAVTVVHPGLTVTERTGQMLATIAERDGITTAQVAENLGAATSIRRLVTATEVADVVIFLCSPRSVAINGDAIAVGGGTRGFISY